jgi:hypothetical protein
MSTRSDKKQKYKVLDSNVFQIQPKGKLGVNNMKIANVLKSEELKRGTLSSLRVNPYVPTEMLGKRVTRSSAASSVPATSVIKTSPASASSAMVQNKALESMKQNLKDLNDLQARLRFVLEELEEFVHES